LRSRAVRPIVPGNRERFDETLHAEHWLSALNRPGYPGGSIPWKQRWSHGQEAGVIEAVPDELKERAIRMAGELRRTCPNDRGVIFRIARQLGVGNESLRA